jgi:glutathione synthase/RimK-type ligase-like ATP-grasp enzyme
MILVVSYPGEEHTAAVVERLVRAGRDVVPLDLGDFLSRAGLDLAYDGDGRIAFEVDTAAGIVDLARARACWWRRVRPFTTHGEVRDPGDRAFVLSETQQAVHGALDSLSCGWINPPREDEAAHRKPYQWTVARAVGLTLPRTLVTSRPDRARAFAAALGPGGTVFKAFLAQEHAWRETRRLREADLAALDGVRLAPVIFQEYVDGVDLRVTVVGERVFAAEIDARGTSYPYDMRMVVGEAPVRAVRLPDAVEAGLLALMRRLGLVYGACDLRRRPDGEHVFLEVNPAGQWLFVEERTGLPIADALAAELMALADRGAGRAGAGGR